MRPLAIDVADVDVAAQRIAPWVTATPLLRSERIDERVGCEVWFKAEHLQRTGSFKFRGGCNAIASLSSEDRSRGVVTYSSGNHAQGIAAAAELLGTSAVIVMPNDAPQLKVDATRAANAEIVHYDRYREDRVHIGERIAREQGRVLIPPYDHPMVIAGQGTVAREVVEELDEIDAFVVCLGGGGLLAGCATVVADRSPETSIYGVEPLAGDDHRRSRLAGQRVHIEVPQTIADGQQTTAPGELTWPINNAHVSDFLAVTDVEIVAAMRVLAADLDVVAEPSGASGFAAVLNGSVTATNRAERIVVTISGGNIGPDRHNELISQT